MVGGGAQGLRDITVRLGLPTQNLTPSLPDELQQVSLLRVPERAQQEEEAAVKESGKLEDNMNTSPI